MARLLVVEDDAFTAKVVEKVLTRIGGHVVEVASEPAGALRALAGHPIDLIVMDVTLHGAGLEGEAIDGLRLTHLIRRNDRWRNIPVILATSHVLHGDRERYLCEAQADDYISKPILDHHAFCAQVDALLRRAQPQGEPAPAG